MPGKLVGCTRFLPSLLFEKSFHAHRLGCVLGLTRDSPPDCWSWNILPIVSMGGMEPQHWCRCRGYYPISVGGQEPFFYHSRGGKDKLLVTLHGCVILGLSEEVNRGKIVPKKPIMAVEYLPPISPQLYSFF